MSHPPVRIRVDRLILDGLAPGTPPSEVEAALRSALGRQLQGIRPARTARIPRLDLRVPGGSTGAAAAEVAGGIARAAEKRR